MDNRLMKVRLRGFKSIADADIEFSDLNVLIGANGAGKSNLIAFFRMLSHMLSVPTGALQRFVAESGFGTSLLHDGPKQTREIEADIVLATAQGRNDYSFRLFHAAGDILLFAEEKCRFSQAGRSENPNWLTFDAGHKEAAILDRTQDFAIRTRSTITGLMRRFVVYHFQDTSPQARIKSTWDAADDRYLKYDAANIAPFLFRMRDQHPRYYGRIVETIRQIAPFFEDFVLEQDHGRLMLRWREVGLDHVFSAYQASDGMLRAMALVTALLQPPETLPALIIIDEPELGLHPYAITIIGGLISAVAVDRQVLVATQSPLLLDQFPPDAVIVVDREARKSKFQRLDPDGLKDWLEDYSLSELWHKNILGGRPVAGHP